MILSRRTARRSLSGLASLCLAASVVAGVSSPSEAFTPDVKTSSRTIAAGDTHTLVITPDGRIYGSGDTGFYQLPGVPTNPSKVGTLTLLDPLPGGVRAEAVAAGQGFSVALGADGAVYGAGANFSWQLTSASGSTQTQQWTKLSGLPPGTIATDVVAGKADVLVVTSTGQLYGTGSNSDGQLTGTGGAAVTTLTPLVLPPGVVAAKAAIGSRYDSGPQEFHYFTVVLGSDGKLYGTGDNTYMQLGSSVTTKKTVLTAFTHQPSGAVTEVAAGESTSYALAGGEVWSYGNDADGRRGCAGCGTSATPSRLAGPLNTGIVSIAAGDTHVVAMSSTAVYGAGANAQGQLAQGASFADRPSLVELATLLASPVELSSHAAEVVVRTRTGEVVGAGGNSYGQLTGDDLNRVSLAVLSGQRMIAYGAPAIPAARFGSSVTPVIDRVWSVRPTGYSYQWYVDDQAVPGQLGGTMSSYSPRAADVGKQLRVVVSGTKAGYAATAPLSSSSVTVLPATFTGGQVAVGGTSGVGRTLTAVVPVVTPTPDASGLQWYRNGVPIAGATGAEYKQVVADAGRTVSVTVTATASGYTPYVSSAARVVPLHATKAPRIKGTATVGRTLRLRSTGTWTPRPSSYRYQWLRNGTVIKKATKTSYRLTRKDKGRRITVRVTARRSGVPAGVATSRPTAKVRK